MPKPNVNGVLRYPTWMAEWLRLGLMVMLVVLLAGWSSAWGNTSYTIGGEVSGLDAGQEVVLSIGDQTVSVSANGSFTFPTPLANDSEYTVVIDSPPANQICEIANDSGTISGANVTNVEVVCANLFALQFNGSSGFIDFANSPAYNSDSLTIEAWVKIPDPTEADSNPIVAWESSISTRNVQFRSSGGFLQLGIDDGSGWTATQSTERIDTGEWVHVAVVKSGSSVELYIDGQLKGTGTNFRIASVDQMFIGRFRDGGTSHFFSGTIDELRIWSTVRTQSQISNNKDRRLTGFEPGLVAYYSMNRGSGVVLDDDSSNEYTGAISEGIAWVLGYHPLEAPLPTFTVSYQGNTSTLGSVPQDSNQYQEGDTVTVLANTGGLSKTGHQFTGWNTQNDGEGVPYQAGDTFSMGTADVTLYAQWDATHIVITDAGGLSQIASNPAGQFILDPAGGSLTVPTDWEPVGTASAPFIGSLQGVNGNMIELVGLNGKPLFNVIGPGAVVSHIDIKNNVINNAAGPAGLLANRVEGSASEPATISHINFTGSSISGGIPLGAVAGIIRHANLDNIQSGFFPGWVLAAATAGASMQAHSEVRMHSQASSDWSRLTPSVEAAQEPDMRDQYDQHERAHCPLVGCETQTQADGTVQLHYHRVDADGAKIAFQVTQDHAGAVRKSMTRTDLQGQRQVTTASVDLPDARVRVEETPVGEVQTISTLALDSGGSMEIVLTQTGEALHRVRLPDAETVTEVMSVVPGAASVLQLDALLQVPVLTTTLARDEAGLRAVVETRADGSGVTWFERWNPVQSAWAVSSESLDSISEYAAGHQVWIDVSSEDHLQIRTRATVARDLLF